MLEYGTPLAQRAVVGIKRYLSEFSVVLFGLLCSLSVLLFSGHRGRWCPVHVTPKPPDWA